MKLSSISLLLTIAVGALGQVQVPKDYKPTADDFRIVDGKLYNIRTSNKWEDLAPNNGTWALRVVTVSPQRNGVFVERFQRSNRADTANTIFVKNLPGWTNLVDNQEIIADHRVMPTGNLTATNKVFGSTTVYRAFDYGLPNTPENRKGMASVKP